jgi:hypothetical protein
MNSTIKSMSITVLSLITGFTGFSQTPVFANDTVKVAYNYADIGCRAYIYKHSITGTYYGGSDNGDGTYTCDFDFGCVKVDATGEYASLPTIDPRDVETKVL